MRVLKKSIWPYKIILKPVEGATDERVIWLTEKLSRDRFYVLGPNTYCFKTQQDAVLFAMKWS